MALTKITGEGLGSLGTGNLTHGSDSGDTRFTLNSANQYTLVLKNAGNIAGQIGGSGSDVLRFSNAAGATIMEMNAGQITKPLQPAFLARVASTQSNLTINTDTTIVFGTEVFDQNSDFDGTSTFTAPVTGRYQFNVNTRLGSLDSATSFYETKIITSNFEFRDIFDPRQLNGDLGVYHSSFAIFTDMDANDTCIIKIKPHNSGSSQADVNTNHMNFSGFLVC